MWCFDYSACSAHSVKCDSFSSDRSGRFITSTEHVREWATGAAHMGRGTLDRDLNPPCGASIIRHAHDTVSTGIAPALVGLLDLDNTMARACCSVHCSATDADIKVVYNPCGPAAENTQWVCRGCVRRLMEFRVLPTPPHAAFDQRRPRLVHTQTAMHPFAYASPRRRACSRVSLASFAMVGGTALRTLGLGAKHAL
jgi:hypothetical protein